MCTASLLRAPLHVADKKCRLPMNALAQLTTIQTGTTYALRLARSRDDLRAAQSLRFAVFNQEMQEGLQSSVDSALDCDVFDAVCDHLLVEHCCSGNVVGTYRMQSGLSAQRNLGYYCAQEFEFALFDSLRHEMVELGRACIAQEHRNFQVLSLLWRGIAVYAQERGARYLVGCSSLSSQDPADGVAAYRQLQPHLAPLSLRTVPTSDHVCALDVPASAALHLPKLLSYYLALGAWICGPPAIDRAFKTIDFLTLMDLQSADMQQRRRRFGINC